MVERKPLLGGTPLADAIRHKHPEAQKLLRDKGAHLGKAVQVETS